MKNIITGAVLSAMLFAGSAVPAFASMTFIGDGYKVPPSCTQVDTSIFEIVDGNTIVTGCWTPAAMDAAVARGKAAQEGVRFGAGQSVVLKTGAVEYCPLWFMGFGGCVIARDLVR